MVTNSKDRCYDENTDIPRKGLGLKYDISYTGCESAIAILRKPEWRNIEANHDADHKFEPVTKGY
jgi:hypothetical protein